MKTFTFFEKDPISYIEKLKDILNDISPDLFVLFLPSYIYSHRVFFQLLKDTLKNTFYISLSSIGVMEGKKIGYDYFGGFAIKFEKSGSFEIYTVKDFSALDINYLKEDILKFLKEGPYTYLLFSTAQHNQINKLLNSIFKSDNYPKVRIYGGIASSNLRDFTTYISENDKVFEDGIILVKLNNIISYNTLSFGFIPVGTTYRITKAEDNKLYEIDGINVEYFLLNLLSDTELKLKDLTPEVISEVFYQFPLLLIDEDRKYVNSIRVIIDFDINERCLKLAGLLREGSLVKLSTGDSEDILKDVEVRAKEFYNMLTYFDRKPELIMNISCAARNYVLLMDKKESIEQEIYSDTLKDFNIVGFLTFGEIGHDRFGKPGEFFNETSILVGLEELDGLQVKGKNT
ncbi:MAG: FIST N-terminal domain-containing protein [Hydrogenothermaceae bacterium]